ncbi:PREDICTED: target of Myb protein 1-like isoform X2 [Tarenaya hassleriana]|nr:PREDICTED: target of Myb protein 1-like isoform X2 [Tarenaya hassleriana]
MAAELVISATNEKLADVDWAKNIEICELVARDERQAKDVIKAIKKRLGSKNPNTQLYAVMLLEMLMNNIGENIHKQVIEVGVLPILVKIVKKKSELPVRERIFLLLDATQTSLGGASGKFPQYYSAYYDLVHAGVKFPRRTHATPNPNPGSTQAAPRNTLNEQLASARKEGTAHQREPEPASPSSILQKASSALEVLKEVLDTIDSQNPEVAKDEFTLDLVEQCSFQKERVMHLVMTSRDERIVSQAIELNEQLQRILTRHDDMLSGRIMESGSSTSNGYHPHSGPGRSTSNGNHQKHELSASTTANHLHSESSSSISNSNLLNHEDDDEEEEEEPEQLFRRLRKGKARAKPEDEEEPFSGERPPPGFLGSSIPGERLNRPLIRPIPSETRLDRNSQSPPVGIPPPPAKHMERERFFKEKKTDGSAISGHMRGLSFSSSRSGSLDFSD